MTTTRQPGEAVAWRWQWPGQHTWGYAGYNLHPDAETVTPLIPASDLEQVIRERDEAVRLLRDSLAELKPFHWALSLKGRIRAFLNNMDNRDGRET